MDKLTLYTAKLYSEMLQCTPYSGLKVLIHQFSFYVNKSFACMYLSTTCMPRACRGQKMVLDSLELELPAV